jgi:N-acetylglutamate synthase-like GNAT family acetyltransferase
MESSNTLDYPLDRLQPLIEYFSPDRVVHLSKERHCLVAEQDGNIIATAAIESDHIVTFFVHPEWQRKGVGTSLLRALEHTAQALGAHRLVAEASLTGASFYERHGYSRTGRVLDGTAGPQIEVEKAFVQSER